jgi:predicted ArsR family transcriptional regulator
MKTFAAVINKHKASKHQIPPGQGWKTRQQVARELGVNPRDLRDHLADAITAKDIEEKKFSEWDAATMKAIPVTCYRIVEPGTPKPAKSSAKLLEKSSQVSDKTSDAIPGIPSDLLPKVRDKILAHPHKTASAIKDLFSTNNRMRLSVKAIRGLLDKSPHNRR